MVVRKPATGAVFWGCARYPTCKATREIDQPKFVRYIAGHPEALAH